MGDFFPPAYKKFPYKEGDALASPGKDGFSIIRVLKIDRMDLAKGESIAIAGKKIVVPVDDYLLVIGWALGKEKYPSIEEAKKAFADRSWTITLHHLPIRSTGLLTAGDCYLGNIPVDESELSGYREWQGSGGIW